MKTAEQILMKESLEKDEIIYLLSTQDKAERNLLLETAGRIRKEYVGRNVYLRGLIELSNICRKNCLYCGIRKDNKKVERYTLDDRQVIDTVRQALDSGFGSIVLQSGERTDKNFTSRVARLVRQIKEISGGKLGITLSCGEQAPETYREWFEAGAHRYLLRVETSSEELYYKWHPNDRVHEYSNRLISLEALKKTGYQVGTGVMIGAPYQGIETLAEDLLLFKELDIDMIGMGPYIPHEDTPVFDPEEDLPSPAERLELTLRMIALLRIIMKDVNIAAATALDVLAPSGRVMALLAGANVFMPNLTPGENAKKYALYRDKPYFEGLVSSAMEKVDEKIEPAGLKIVYDKWGDSPHFTRRVVIN